jgi:hypothetical protein
MLLVNNNEVLYSVELNGDGTCDMYNFRTMYHNSIANYSLLQIEFPNVGAVEARLTAPFVLILEFYSNIRNPQISSLLERVTSLLQEHEFNFKVEESPLRLVAVGMDVDDVCILINLEEFQLLCKELTSMSAWHFLGTNSFD